MKQVWQWRYIIMISACSFCASIPLLSQTTTAGTKQIDAKQFEIDDVKLCREVDQNRKPIGITREFPPDTQSVHAWFSWKNGYAGLQITARWHFVSEDIHILDFPVTLTRRTDAGVVSLEMPRGKKLPSGAYRLDLDYEGTIIQSVTFTVLPGPNS